jgi:anti-sigma factor RsiW
LQDHQREIIEKQRRNWLSDEAQVADLASEQGVSAPMLAQLAPDGYRLEHGKICRLNGREYLHLVYQNPRGEVSLFLHESEAGGQRREGKLRYATGLGNEHLTSVQAGTLSVVYVSGDAGEADRFADRAAAVL